MPRPPLMCCAKMSRPLAVSLREKPFVFRVEKISRAVAGISPVQHKESAILHPPVAPAERQTEAGDAPNKACQPTRLTCSVIVRCHCNLVPVCRVGCTWSIVPVAVNHPSDRESEWTQTPPKNNRRQKILGSEIMVATPPVEEREEAREPPSHDEYDCHDTLAVCQSGKGTSSSRRHHTLR